MVVDFGVERLVLMGDLEVRGGFDWGMENVEKINLFDDNQA